MGWKQTTNFDLNKMGTTAGMCLQNVRLGYGIAPKYASARDAMNACKARGTFHEGLADIPQDVDVPLFAETGSPYAHVMVDVHGAVYSDGKYLPSFAGMSIVGWSEELNDVRVVEWVEEPAPAPAPAPAPEPTPEPVPEPEDEFKVGDVVVPTRLVDYNGTPLVQYDDTYTITQINGDRAVLSARGAVWAAMNIADIRKA
jgi:hypothetical protein